MIRTAWEVFQILLTGTTIREVSEKAERRREELWRRDPEQAKRYGVRKPKSMRNQ